MSTMEAPRSDLFDLAPLLAPIAGEHATGEWLRYDAVYREIRKLREADDPSLPMGVWQHELKRADWQGVADSASQALATRSKDLQLAVWLTEAWLHRSGYAGFAAGLRLLTALCREYWEGLYPPLDGESTDARLSPLVWAAEKLLPALKSVPVTAPVSEDARPLTWADCEYGLYYDNLEKRGVASAGAQGKETITYPKFLISASLTPATFYATLAHDLAEVRAAIDDLDDTLGQLAGEDKTPSFGQLRGLVEAIGSFAERILNERMQSGEIGATSAGGEAIAGDFPPFPHEALGTFAGSISSRGEAFLRLREAAEFLMRTEPHSPVPYLVMRAVSWEHLPLADLFAELLRNSNDLAAVYSLLGMNREG
jgi:type VI secretion system ImpA family protein